MLPRNYDIHIFMFYRIILIHVGNIKGFFVAMFLISRVSALAIQARHAATHTAM